MAYRNDSSNVDYRTGYTGKKEKVMRLLISKISHPYHQQDS